MATKTDPSKTVATAADTAAVPEAPVATGPSPDNTPVPGGGRWLWDIQKPGWVRPPGEPDDLVDPASPAAAN